MTSDSLLIDLAGVARLADVQRPVASMWRSRFGSSEDPFPPVSTVRSGRPLFDALDVAQWLVRTDHGNNPDAVADAATASTPAGFDIANADHVAAVDALLALRVASGAPVGDLADADLRQRARSIDPDDVYLATEAAQAIAPWRTWADLLSDAAYSPLGASRLIERRHATTASPSGSLGPLTDDASSLLIALVHALSNVPETRLVLDTGITPSFAAEIISKIGNDADVTVVDSPSSRAIRRRLACEGALIPANQQLTESAQTRIVRLPSVDASTAAAVWREITELVLGMREVDRALVLAPASVLTERLPRAEALARTDALRSGRVRAIVKLPVGMITSSPREALAVWVLGRDMTDLPIADRFTAVADLTDAALTPAARADLASDMLAALGSHLDLRAHAFRFARMLRTTRLLIARGSLVPSASHRDATVRLQDVPALLDQALAKLGDDAPMLVPTADSGDSRSPMSVEELIAARHLRMITGVRIGKDDVSRAGLVLIGAADLDDPRVIGRQRIDALTFAAQYPSARLTLPGDVVFRTAPTACAWVDTEGSSIVAYPARVLRIDRADPGGLVPELMVADISSSVSGPGSWRRWRLRRVAPGMMNRFRASLTELSDRRAALERRIEALDSYTDLLSTGVTGGAVTLTDNAADAASASR